MPRFESEKGDGEYSCEILIMVLCESLTNGRIATIHEKRLRANVFTPSAPNGAFPFTNVNVRWHQTRWQSEAAHPKQVDVRKHFGALRLSAVPNLGVTCPQFFRCEAPRSSQLSIFQSQRFPCADHIWRLPGPPKQNANC